MIAWILKQRTAIYALSVLIIIVGVMAYIQLPREDNPEIKQPWIFVTTVYAGVPPEDMENLVTRPLEEALDGLEGVNIISSSSKESVSFIYVEFKSDIPVETALRKVKDRVDGARGDLPADAQMPVVKELNSADWPVFIVVLSHPDGVEALDAPAKALKDELKRVNGVLDVSIAGNISKELAVDLDPFQLSSYDLTIRDVVNSIRGDNAAIPGGVLRTEAADYTIGVNGEIQEAGDFGKIIVANGPVSVPLEKLGIVALKPARAETYSRLDGKPAITLEIKKRTGSNVIKMVDEAKERIDAAKSNFPEGTEIVYSYDSSQFIKDTISDLENSMFTGFVLVILVTVFFLGKRNALFVSLAIPFSMLISFFVLQAMGITLNMIVLFSLILALGMLVDNGIVMVENIFRHATMGKDRRTAALDGTKEIAGPIIASTLTTCLAFFPIIFMPGIMGDFMAYVPITTIVVLLSSLVVALTINPVFCSRFLGVGEKARKKLTEGSGFFMKVQVLYEALVRRAIARPLHVVGISFLIVAAGFGVYFWLGKEPIYFPQADPATAYIEIEGRQGTPLDTSDQLARRIEAMLPSIESSMDHYSVTVGASDSRKSTIRVEYKPYLEREISGTESTENIKDALVGFIGAKVSVYESEDGPPSGHSISYEITGEDYTVLGNISDQIISILETHKELKGISSDYESVKPEVSVVIDRNKAAFFGLSASGIADTVRSAFHGASAGSFRSGKDEYDIMVRYADGNRNSLEQLKSLLITGNDGIRVPLTEVADISIASSIGVIKRINLNRAVSINADFKEDVQNKDGILKDTEEAIADLDIPTGYRIGTGEGVQIQQESTDFLIQAFMVAIFLIAIVLLVQFNSFIDPLIILSSVILSMGGVFWGYALTGQAFVVIMSGIGCIALAGVVVNNCIVLVDYTKMLIRDGMPWSEAIILAGKTRLRPILLTAITTILGMIPMALGVSFDIHSFTIQVGSEQSEFWRAFAWAMVYGLSFATVMTLVVVPSLLALKYRLMGKKEQSTESIKDEAAA